MAAARVPDEARRWWETFSNGAPRVPDKARRWWETFSNGAAVDEGEEEEEPDVDSDSSFEEEEEEGEQKAGAVASESHREMAAARVARKGTSGHGDEEEVSEDAYVQLQGGLLGTKRKAVATHAELQSTRTEIQDKQDHDEYIAEDKCVHIGGRLQGMKREAIVTLGKLQRTIGTEIYDKNAQGECLRAENEMPNELEAQQIRRLELELNLKTKEIKSLKKQNEELRIENEHYRKTIVCFCPGVKKIKMHFVASSDDIAANDL
ncbi:hypothetical protein ACQ4PT_052943 [Festuca glaucescens]